MKNPITVALAAALWACATSAAADLTAPWQVETSIGVRYVDAEALTNGPVEWSPNRDRFFFILRRGILACDCVEREILVFDARTVSAAMEAHDATPPRPLARTIVRSGSGEGILHRGIMDARWADNERILFKQSPTRDSSQLMMFDVSRGRVAAISRAYSTVFWNAELEGPGLAFVASSHEGAAPNPLDAYPSLTVIGGNFAARALGQDQLYSRSLYASYRGRAERRLAHFPLSTAQTFGPWLSPDGRWTVLAYAPADELPQDTSERQGAERIYSYVLFDTRTGERRVIAETNAGRAGREGALIAPQAVWAGDTIIALNAIVGSDAAPRIVAYSPANASPLTDLAPMRPANMTATGEWYANIRAVGPRSVEVRYVVDGARHSQSLDRTLTITQDASRWSITETLVETAIAANSVEPPFAVAVREDMNTPPVVEASSNGVSIRLIGHDPALTGVERLNVETVTWTDPDGQTEEAGFLAPARVEGAPPPPLVIQAYVFDPHQFSPDGPFATAYAAQALAARGFAVLTMDIPTNDRRDRVLLTPEEGRYFVRRLDAAVEQLSERGLIDRNRVGLVGFSRAGFLTYYAVTHPGSVALIAAVAADAHTGSYGEYIGYAATGSGEPQSVRRQAREFDLLHSETGSIFWDDSEAWFANAPGFGVHRSNAPTLFTLHGMPGNLLGAIETIGAFRITGRPFEYVVYPNGSHELQLPRERQASMNDTVRWLSFWMLDETDPDTELAPMYARWRDMRGTQDAP